MRSLFVCLLAISCVPTPPEEGEGEEGEGEGEAASFSWEARDDVTVPNLWGGILSEGESAEQAFVLGGVSGDLGPVVSEINEVFVRDGRVRSSSTIALDGPRYCGCAMLDPTRRELVVIGGRNGAFLDVESAVVVSLDTGVATPIADAPPAQFPIGCQAHFFGAPVDAGYVFSGLSSNRGAFGPDTYRWDPEARTFTAVDVEGGPRPRYDASVHPLDLTSFLMVGGMGLQGGGAVFFSDVWTFDAGREEWREIPTTSADVPPGRRYPWAALSVDDDTLLYGYGSDSEIGETMLGDLWRFTLSTGEWSPIEAEGAPDARGFSYRLPGPAGTAGALVGGLKENQVAADEEGDAAFFLRVPADFEGTWR